MLNTSGLTVIPISIMVYRAQAGAVNPSDVFLPILLATFINSLVGLIVVAAVQRINLLDKVVLAYILGLTAMIAGTIWYFTGLPQERVQALSNLIANLTLFGVISSFIILGLVRRINVYEVFIEGAKEGFTVAIRIIPYLVAILVAIGVLRASGALDVIVSGLGSIFAAIGLDTSFVPALPTAIMKPLSGSGARGMMVDAMNTYGADSFVGRLAGVMQGTSDTTFYILALYFGSVGIRKTRHAVACGLLADLSGIIAAIFIAYIFFG